MSSAPDADISLSNISCRILVLSPKISEAKACIDRIQKKGQQPHSTSSGDNITEQKDPSESSSGLIKIPWTITNKYYSALVHFAAHRMQGLIPLLVQNIPAVIFVWSKGESYRHHIERIAQDLSQIGSEPEVCLAVRLEQAQFPRTASEEEDEEEEEEDDSEIDGFLSSRGFEYIDATEKHLAHGAEEEASDEDDWSSEIPGLERVLDALSTIMWPSMQPTTKNTTQTTKTRERERALLDWANTSQDHSLLEVEDVVASSSEQLSDRSTVMQREMQELSRWLEEDHAMREDPWKSAASSGIGIMSTSPTAMEIGEKAHLSMDGFGFDDDFTVFVSAPAPDPAEISGRSTPDAFVDGLSPSSAGPHAGSLYRSLGSVSDFGGSDDGKDVDDDVDLPTKEEIQATSSRIFGSPKFPLPPGLETRANTARAPNSSDRVSVGALGTEGFAADRAGSYDMEPFDLSKVLGTLQEMKAEISTIENEDERRKAAARVALGLVYGLEADEDV